MITEPKTPKEKTRKIAVKKLLEGAPGELALELLAGDVGTGEKDLDSERIQKLGLALAGFPDYIHSGRIQMIGRSEISYLESLNSVERRAAIVNLPTEFISCILITKGLSPPDELLSLCDSAHIPLIRTPLVSSKAIGLISEFLNEVLAPEVTIHGVLLEMFGLGVLVLGESGIGKSECALDLISRGHRLVSDDVVRIRRIGKRLSGESPELTFEHLEIHGLGIINVRELFGVSSMCKNIRVDLCIELIRQGDIDEVERIGIGLETKEHDLMGVRIPRFSLPVRPGRNLGTLFETAVKVFLLRVAGYDAASVLIEKHTKMLGRAADQGSLN